MRKLLRCCSMLVASPNLVRLVSWAIIWKSVSPALYVRVNDLRDCSDAQLPRCAVEDKSVLHISSFVSDVQGSSDIVKFFRLQPTIASSLREDRDISVQSDSSSTKNGVDRIFLHSKTKRLCRKAEGSVKVGSRERRRRRRSSRPPSHPPMPCFLVHSRRIPGSLVLDRYGRRSARTLAGWKQEKFQENEKECVYLT